MVSDGYKTIKYWIEFNDFGENVMPKSVEEYKQYISNELDFVAKRNNRIEKDSKIRFDL